VRMEWSVFRSYLIKSTQDLGQVCCRKYVNPRPTTAPLDRLLSTI
jgi:hypothetical protein